MAIARDTFLVGSKQVNTATVTESYTNAGNVLVVFAVNTDPGGGAITNVKANGVTMISTGSSVTTGSGVQYAESFYLVNPPTGTYDIVMTVPNDTGNVNELNIISYTGASTAQPDSTDVQTELTSSTSFSNSITIVNANSWVACVGYHTGASFTSGTGVLTLLGDDSDSFATMIADSDGVLSAGAQTYGMSGVSSATLYALAVAIAPANLKSINGLAIASVKSVNGLAIASVKSVNGLA